MKTLIALMLLSTAALADVNEIDNNKTHAVDCAQDATVRVSGNSNTFVLKGTCKSVQISGNKNTVKGDGVRLVVVDLVDVGERRRREEHQRDERLHGLLPRLAASFMVTTGASASASASASLAIPCGASRSHSAAW